SGKIPRASHLLSDRFASRTLIYKNRSLKAVLRDLGKKEITSVMIEGGGDVLGQALDAQLIDKVHIYAGSILTGGPVIAFPGSGSGTAQSSALLERVSYRRVGQSICITTYPKFDGITTLE